nr:nucleolin 2-like [Arachis hypogaea]
MCKGCRRNHNLINIYLENCISQPCIVDILEEEVVNVEAESLKQRKPMEANKCSSQPVKKPTAMVPESKKQTSNPNKTTLQPKSQPNKPTIKPIFEPNKPIMKPNSEPTKPVYQPRKTTSQPMNPVPQAKKTSHQAKSVPPQSNASSQGDKDSSSGCRVTRSGRQVKEAPLHEDDSDSHDSYESIEDELYRPPKVVGDNLYSSDSDSDSGSKKSSGKGDSRSKVRDKHKPPKKRLGDKEIETDDSKYEGSEDEQSSESDLDDSDGASDADSWHSENSDQVLESDEESPAVYP